MKKLLCVLMLLSISLYGAAKPALVNTAKIKQEVVNPLEEFIGTLHFARSANIAAQTSGAVEKVQFELGQRVKEGDILIIIDSKTLMAQINSAKASLNIAQLDLKNSEKDYNRYKVLLEKNSISQQTFDNIFLKFHTAKQNLLVAQSKLKELEVEQSKKTIKAPFDGVIVNKSIEKSEWLNAGTVVATLINEQELELIFNLPSSYTYKLDKDEAYEIQIQNTLLQSKLYAAIPKGNQKTRTFPVKFKVKENTNSFFYEGMEATIKLPRDKKQTALVVPRDAVIKRFNKNIVFLNIENKAIMVPVKIIGYTKENIAVEAQELKEGIDVVIKGNERIYPNQELKSLDK